MLLTKRGFWLVQEARCRLLAMPFFSVTTPSCRPSSTKQAENEEDERPLKAKRMPRENPNAEDIVVISMESQFESTPQEKRDRAAFFAAIAMFKDKRMRNHVEFIETALRYMKEFGVHRDLDCYKALLNILPKGPYIPTNNWQKMFVHFPKQQFATIKLLDQMEWHHVYPDKEINDIVVNTFGQWNFATKKMKRMMYWAPKLRHTNKYLDKRTVENRDLSASELAARALRMMSRDPATEIICYEDKVLRKDEQDRTNKDDDEQWVVSAQSPLQRRLIERMSEMAEMFVDGPFRVWVTHHPVSYVTLTTAPNPLTGTGSGIDALFAEEKDAYTPDYLSEWKSEREKIYLSVHEQADATILAMGSLSSNNNDMARRWIDELRAANPRMEELQVRYRLSNLPRILF